MKPLVKEQHVALQPISEVNHEGSQNKASKKKKKKKKNQSKSSKTMHLEEFNAKGSDVAPSKKANGNDAEDESKVEREPDPAFWNPLV